MSEFVQITTTTGKRQDAEQIAAELVSRKLAACVQVSGPIVSTFRWRGKIETGEEWLCVIKTNTYKIPEIERAFDEIHPYEVPEMIATPISACSKAYRDWLKSELET